MQKFLLTLCLSGAIVLSLDGAASAQNGPTDPYGGLEGRLFDAGGGFMLPYRLGKPPAYNAANKYPLVIFLHGSGESGTDNRLQISKNIGTNTPGSVFTTAANQAKFPTFFIAPQTPTAGIGWKSGSKSLVAALKLITALEAEFSIDPKRLYITGLSLGGMGTFTAIQENPTLFAAAVPMSGSGDPTKGATIAKIPLWAFHGTIDPAVNVSGSRDMIAAMKAAGGMPRYTEYPNGMHDIWFMAYNTPDLLPWMNAQRVGVLDPQADGGWPADAGGGDASTNGTAGSGGGTGGSTAGNTGSTGGTTGTVTGMAGTVGSTGGTTGTVTGMAGTVGSTGGTTGTVTGMAGNTALAGMTGSTGSAGTRGGGGGGGGGCQVGVAPWSAAGLAGALALLLFGRRRRR